MTNGELVERFSRVEFSYFRQISFVLATVTLFFGFLLITVLLTASVNQRLGEIAALRALGLSRGRVVAGVFCESAADGRRRRDSRGAARRLRCRSGSTASCSALPGIPADVHFFVFESRALVSYTLAAVAAAPLAPRCIRCGIVATLPIAATLRREVVG